MSSVYHPFCQIPTQNASKDLAYPRARRRRFRWHSTSFKQSSRWQECRHQWKRKRPTELYRVNDKNVHPPCLSGPQALPVPPRPDPKVRQAQFISCLRLESFSWTLNYEFWTSEFARATTVRMCHFKVKRNVWRLSTSGWTSQIHLWKLDVGTVRSSYCQHKILCDQRPIPKFWKLPNLESIIQKVKKEEEKRRKITWESSCPRDTMEQMVLKIWRFSGPGW